MQVLANPLIPQPNKQMAQEQHAALWASCHSAISAWVEAACSSAAFQTLQPAMAGLAASIDASVLLDETLQTNKGVEAGKLMEAAAVQVGGSALRPAQHYALRRLPSEQQLAGLQDTHCRNVCIHACRK